MAAPFLHRATRLNQHPRAPQIQEAEVGQVQLNRPAARGVESCQQLAQSDRGDAIKHASQHQANPGSAPLNSGPERRTTVARLRRLDISRVDTHSQPPAIGQPGNRQPLPLMTIEGHAAPSPDMVRRCS